VRDVRQRNDGPSNKSHDPSAPGSADPNQTPESGASGIRRRWLFASHTVRIAAWACCAHDGGLGKARRQPWNLISFNFSGSYCLHQGGETLFIDPSQVTFFNAQVDYRTSHPLGVGDRGGSLIPDTDTLLEILRIHDQKQPVNAAAPFSLSCASASGITYLLMWTLVRRLSLGPKPEPIIVDELALRIIGKAMSSDGARSWSQYRDSPGSGDRLRAAVKRARIHIAHTLAENLSLLDVARAARCSPYHLCRAFRRETGMTMTRYRTCLRLRAALNHIDGDLSTLAGDLGFASHSHFTESFRREFGQTPTNLRRLIRSRREELLLDLGRGRPSFGAGAQD
jgi:AraC family transcriptional regulator